MKGASRINKQIRNNIARLTEDRRDKSAMVSHLIVKIMVVIIAITIPFSSISIAANIVFKNQDVYGFEFERSGILSQVNDDLTPQELAAQMVAFMTGKEDIIKAKASYNETYSDVFTDEDIETFKTLRTFLDRILVFAIIFLFVDLLLFAILYIAERKKELRQAFNAGGIIYIFLVIFSLLIALVESVRDKVFDFVFDIVHASSSIIPIVFTGYYRAFAVALIAIIAFIIYAIIYTIGLRFFKERKMFDYTGG